MAARHGFAWRRVAQAGDFEACASQDGGVQVMLLIDGGAPTTEEAFADSVEHPVARSAKSKQLFDQELISKAEYETS